MVQGQPKNYLIESILITIFCCQPFGIVSFVYASQVNSKYTAGDYEALQSSKEAKKWIKWGFISGLIIVILFLLFYGFMFFVTLNEDLF